MTAPYSYHVCVCACLSVFVSYFCLFYCSSVCVSVCVSACLSVCVSVYLQQLYYDDRLTDWDWIKQKHTRPQWWRQSSSKSSLFLSFFTYSFDVYKSDYLNYFKYAFYRYTFRIVHFYRRQDIEIPGDFKISKKKC